MWRRNPATDSKTEVTVFGRHKHYSDCADALPPFLGSKNCSVIKSLGVTFDSDFKFDRQIGYVVKSAFFQLRLLARVKPYLSPSDLEKVIHALISTRLDYCNSLYVGLDQRSLRRLQLVQNAAARLLTGTKKREHISPVLASLHWLPVRFRIDFKILMFVFKILIHRPTRALRSANESYLNVPQCRLKTKGDRSFAVAAPKLWNSLPLHIRASETLDTFKSSLKTHFFSQAYEPV